MNSLYNTVLHLVCILMLSSQAYAGLRVVTTTQDLAAIAHAIGGKHIDVQSLTAGTRDPHFAVAKPSMIRRVFGADLLLVIGADMEIGWLPPLLQAARNSRVQPGNPGYLDLSETVSLLGKSKGPITRAMGDVHAKGNPHYWLDPRNGERMARAVTERLVQLDPEHTTAYKQNLKLFTKTVNKKLPEWRKQLQHLKDKPVIAYHNSLIYLADAFGFNIVDEVEPKPGISPGASSLNELVKKIKQNNITLLLIEPYYERRSTHYLKEQTGIQIAVVPQSVGAWENIVTYTDLFDNIVKSLQSDRAK